MLDTRPSAPGDDTVVVARPAGDHAWFSRLALALPSVLMLVLGLWGLRRDDAMGNDEVATRWISSLSLPDMRHVLSHLDAVHGLYYVLIHYWAVFGRSPATIRLPSVLATVLAVAVVAVLARRLIGSTRAGVAAGLIAASTSTVSFYAQTARAYTMVYLVLACSTYVLVRALEHERTPASALARMRPWLLYGLLVVLGAYLNELSLLLLGAHLITVLLARPGRAAVARWLGVSALAVLAVLPLIRLSQQQSSVLDYLQRPDGSDVWTLVHTLFGGSTVVAVLVAAVALVGVVAKVPARPSSGPKGTLSPATVALPMLVVPAALLMLYSLVAAPLYADRYVLYSEIGAAVLAAAGLEWLAQRLSRPRRAADATRTTRMLAPAAVLAACVAVFLGQLGGQQFIRTPQSRQFDFGGPAAYVGAHARPGDGVLFFGLFYRKTRLGYPADFRDTTDLAQAVSPEREASFRGRNKPFGRVRPLMLDYNRIWVIGRPPGSTSSAVSEIRLQALELRQHFVKIEQRRFGKVNATLWHRI